MRGSTSSTSRPLYYGGREEGEKRCVVSSKDALGYTDLCATDTMIPCARVTLHDKHSMEPPRLGGHTVQLHYTLRTRSCTYQPHEGEAMRMMCAQRVLECLAVRKDKRTRRSRAAVASLT